MPPRRAKNTSLVRIRSVLRLPPRAPDANKGDFGRVLVLAGSVGMAGAPTLVGLSALRTGAGLVIIAVPHSIQPGITTICPCATTIGLPETSTGQIDPDKSRKLLADRGFFSPSYQGGAAGGESKATSPPDVLVTGPGVGGSPPPQAPSPKPRASSYASAFWDLINAFRNSALVPAVIDADALNLARRSTPHTPNGWDAQPHYRTIITPHPGEMGRLHGVTAGQVQADREGFAVRTAQMMADHRTEPDYMPVVVLKGARTLVTDGHRIYENRTGNPGMATGGSGDVLSGIIAALVGQGLAPFDAAATGVYVHGLAGDIAAKRRGQVSLIATDIIDSLPDAFARLGTKSKR